MAPVNRRRRVDVVDDEVEVAAVVQIHVDGAIRESLLIEPPRFADTGEREVPVVVEQVILLRDLRHFLQQFEIRGCDRVLERRLHCILTDVGYVVEVIGPPINSVAHEQILATVVVEVGEERGPAPVGRRHASEIPDLTEFPVPTIQLQVVARKLREVPSL